MTTGDSVLGRNFSHIWLSLPSLRYSKLPGLAIAISTMVLLIACFVPYRPAWGQSSLNPTTPVSVGNEQAPLSAAVTSLKTRIAVFVDKRPDKALRVWLVDRLARIGEEVEPAPDGNNLGNCWEYSCLADQVSQGTRLLILHVSVGATTRRYYIEAILLEYGAASTVKSHNACEECSQENMQSIVGELSSQLLAGNRGSRTGDAGQPTAGAPGTAEKLREPDFTAQTVSVPAASGDESPDWTYRKIALTSLTSTLTLVGLVTTGYLIYQSQQPDHDRLCFLPPSLTNPSRASDYEQAKQESMRQSDCSGTTAITIGSALVTASVGALTGIAFSWRESGRPRKKPSRAARALGVR